MMFWYDHGVSGWGWAAMTIGMVLFWALIIGAGVLLFRALTGGSSQAAERGGSHAGERGGPVGPDGARPTPEQLLAERFARGEIDEDEYRARLAVLHGGTATLRKG